MCREREQICITELLNCSREISQQKRKEIRGQTRTCFMALSAATAAAPDICYVAIVLLPVAAQSYRPREAFLGY